LPSFPIGGPLTVEAWVESDNVNAFWARVFDFGDGAVANNIVLAWQGATGQMALLVADPSGGFHTITTTAVFPQNTWVHVAATIDEGGNGAIYWNGALVASGSVGVPPVEARLNQYVGRSNWWSDAPFQGSMDDIEIWKGARTAEQIGQDMTAVPTGLEGDLEARYRLDEGQGLLAGDSSAKARDAALASNQGNPPEWTSSGRAIDLGGDGVTRPAPSPRSGPNEFQNSPVIVTSAGGVRHGWLSGSLPDT